MADFGFENLFRSRVNPQMTLVDSTTGQAEILPSWQVQKDDPVKKITDASTNDPFRRVSTLKNTSKGSIDSTIDLEGVEQPTITAKAVQHYADSVAGIMKAGAAIGNGYIAMASAEGKKMAYEFKAAQNRRAAELLLENQVEITRAAQMDANQYRIAGTQTKSKQVIGMASSGFAVGKGTFKNTLNTTEARVNYNVANLMLRAELQNAELTRKAGYQMAEAIINEANADIAGKEGDAAVVSGWINGISNFISAGASFYCGRIENGALSGTKISKTTGPDGNKAWAVNGKAMYGRS